MRTLVKRADRTALALVGSTGDSLRVARPRTSGEVVPWGGDLTFTAVVTNEGETDATVVDVGGRRHHVFGRDWRREPVQRWVEERARSVAAPVPPWPRRPLPEGQAELPRAVFAAGVVEALRTWHAPREFATSVLLGSHLVPRGSDDPVADLRSAILVALDALQADAAGVRAHRALTVTYVAAPRTHRAAAHRLGVPYGTFRRHLALAGERLIEQLRHQTSSAVTVPGASPGG